VGEKALKKYIKKLFLWLEGRERIPFQFVRLVQEEFVREEVEMKRIKLAVASGKGGVGKSMVASCLAMLFQREKRKVVAVDCDVDAPNLHLWLGERENWETRERISTNEQPVIDKGKCIGCGKCVETCAFGALDLRGKRPRLNKYFCEGCGACEVVCPVQAIKMEKIDNAEVRERLTKYGFRLVSAQLFPGQTGSGKIVEEIKSRVDKSAWEVMVLDSPAGIGCPVIAALKDTDFVVLVTEPTPSGLADLKRVLVVVGHFNLRFGVVINKWDINKRKARKIEGKFRKQMLGKISYDKRVFKAISNLKPIIETNLRVREEIEKIYGKLRKIN
jgi:MinD superfamily P-loop ATPase